MNNSTNIPLLSIVIPTRNRQTKALAAARSILKLFSDDIQLIVHDCSDSNDLEEMLGDLKNDPRLCFRYSSAPYSLTENFEAASELILGEYLVFIGDDDLVLPEIMQIARWAHDNDIDSVRSDFYAYYYWPDLRQNPSLRHKAGLVELREFVTSARFTNTPDALRELVAEGGQNYLYLDLPKIYHGLVRSSCLAQVKHETGTYFGGLSPDIYGAVAVSKYIRRSTSISFPMTINGTSFSSGASDSASGAHRGKLQDAPHLQNNPDYEWSAWVPAFYSVATIWADSAIAALKATHQTELLKDFTISTLFAYCIVQNPSYIRFCVRELVRVTKERNESLVVNFGMTTLRYTKIQIVRVVRKMKRLLRRDSSPNKVFVSAVVSDSEAAADLLVHYLRSTSKRVDASQIPLQVTSRR